MRRGRRRRSRRRRRARTARRATLPPEGGGLPRRGSRRRRGAGARQDGFPRRESRRTRSTGAREHDATRRARVNARNPGRGQQWRISRAPLRGEKTRERPTWQAMNACACPDRIKSSGERAAKRKVKSHRAPVRVIVSRVVGEINTCDDRRRRLRRSTARRLIVAGAECARRRQERRRRAKGRVETMSFNRLLLVIKQTAFDAYTAQEQLARAAGRALSYDNARMGASRRATTRTCSRWNASRACWLSAARTPPP